MTDALPSASFRYALRRVAIFPLAPGSKVPIRGSHGLRDATDDHDVCRSRWEQTPQANIGAATGSRSGFWVLDIDPPDGPESLGALETEHGPLPVTTEASTPRGGRHLYWRHVEGIRNSAGRIGVGLDVRGEGGSIILPPSVRADGRCYRWVDNGAHSFANVPEWLVRLALPPPPPPKSDPKPPPADTTRYVATAITDELHRLEKTQEGTRNDQLNRSAFTIAGFAHAGAVPDDWARGELERRAVGIGLPTQQARRTIDSAFKAAHARELPR